MADDQYITHLSLVCVWGGAGREREVAVECNIYIGLLCVY